MWPRLVASKLFSSRLGNSNFFTDFPCNIENLLEISSLDPPSSYQNTSFNHQKGTQNYKVFVSTWNVGGLEPHDDLNIEDWLDTCDTLCDIYVFGFQEVVPLKPSNVLGSENGEISAKWNSLIREALNKKTLGHERSPYMEHGGTENKFSLVNDRSNDSSIELGYHCIISKQMVGILISVWVRSDLCPFVRHQSVSCVGCGIMGCLGNKGSVSVRFQLHETSFCFVCTHLASGGREGDEKNRNSNIAEIFSRTRFPGRRSLLPQKILDHDRVIMLGDLNYRISLPEATIRTLVDRKGWHTLLENDQLGIELMNGELLGGWQEGNIEFAPTYKYWPNSDAYYVCLSGTKSEKKRAPAWCDRIIWYGKGLKQHLYTRGESKLSDHRPVKAIFTVEVGVAKIKALRSFFLSDRFEQLKTQIEMSSADDLQLRSRSKFQLQEI